MAMTWDAKAPGDVSRYVWTPVLVDGDSVASYTASASGATIDADSLEDDAVVVFVSGGTAATTATFTLSAVTTEGETLTETIYLPIIASTVAFGYTAREIVAFALRKITGDDATPTAAQSANALEMLGDMLAMWKRGGIDAGMVLPLTLDTVLYVDDGFAIALKYNLRLAVHAHYGAEIGQIDVQMANDGKRVLTNASVTFNDLKFARTLTLNGATGNA